MATAKHRGIDRLRRGPCCWVTRSARAGTGRWSSAASLAMAFGPQAGLELVDELADEPALKGYHLLPSVRGDLLRRVGRPSEACGSTRCPSSASFKSLASELIDRAADLAAESATLVHENERRWRVDRP